MTEAHYYYGTGKRKTAIAQVKLFSGSGPIIINGKSLEQYFLHLCHREAVLKPLRLTELVDQLHALVKVHGGGITAQAEAIRHGLSRALEELNPALRSALKKAGLLTRDARVKERKKYGLKRARKAPQYTKR